MRLSTEQIDVIRHAARNAFGSDASVRLFGSRTDDSARGGDIDLYIETVLADANAVVRAETAFLAELYRLLGEQKIDLLVDYPARTLRPPIFDIARRTGVPL